MSILPPATVAHGRDQIGKLNLPVPDVLLSARDQEDWQYYISCLPPHGLIQKFAESIDQFHALVHPIRDNPSVLDIAGRDLILSKWNAAVCAAIRCTERFGYTLSPFAPCPGDAVAEGMRFLGEFMQKMEHPDATGWAGRQTYYNDLDSMIVQDMRDDYFNRQNAAFYARPSPSRRMHP